MFVSPCTRRSTQCAALIALAAVAGIARVETTRPAASAAQHSSPAAAHQTSRSLERLSGYAAPTWTSPWLHPIATVALWILTGTDSRASSDLTPTSAPTVPAGPHFAFAPAPAAIRLPDAAISSSGLVHPTPPRPALSTRTHLIPFAVGPPADALTFIPRAVGTVVPADDTVRCSPVSPSASTFSCFDARLACPEFSGPALVGPSIAPSSALRGKPARLSASLDLCPSLGASARPGRRSLPLFS